MFQIIETVSDIYLRIPKLTGEDIKPGHIVEFMDDNGNIVCKLSNGERPIGICGGKKGNIIKIWTQLMLFRSDKFDKNAEYYPGDPIYSYNGLITTKKPFENCLSVGNVVFDFTKEKGLVECKWL